MRKAWTDSGEAHARRGLMQRVDCLVRIVPAPPPLMRMLCERAGEFGTVKDGKAVCQRARRRHHGLVALAGVEACSGSANAPSGARCSGQCAGRAGLHQPADVADLRCS